MPLGREVGLSRDDIMLDGDPAPPKGAQTPPFLSHVYCGQRVGCIRIPLGTEVDLASDDIVLDETQLPLKGAQSTIFGSCVCGQNG